MSQRKMGTILSYIHIIVTNSISIIYTPYMLRMMGQSEYGLYGTANSFIAYLSVLSFGIGGAYIRFNARCHANHDEEGEKRLNGMFLTIFSILAFLVFIGGMAFIILAQSLVSNTFTVDELYKLRVIMLLMTFNMMITFIFNVVQMALQAYEQFICIRLVLLIAAIVQPILNIIVLQKGGRAVSITAVTLCVSIICYIFFFLYARRVIKIRFSFRGFRWSEFRELFIFSAFLFINSITDQITFSTDNVVLSSVRGTAAVAIYTVGANFKAYFQNFSVSISSVFAPQVNLIVAEKREKKELDDLFIRIGRIQFYVVSLILIGYICMGKQFILIWAGADYGDSFLIGLLLILAVFVPAIQNVGLEIQKAMNMHKARSIVYFFIALVNVILTIFFTQWWGGIGAAFATMLCMFVGTVIFMNYYYHKKMGLNIPRFWKEIISIIPSLFPTVLVGTIIKLRITLDSYWDILLATLLMMIVFIIGVWFWGMNQFERNLIHRPIEKCISKIKMKYSKIGKKKEAAEVPKGFSENKNRLLKTGILPEKCVGCGACVNICPTKCLQMTADREGFLYPAIAISSCVNCKKCESVCPIRQKMSVQIPQECYAIKNKNESVRLKSSSGGVFSALAETILNLNGVIYGAAVAEDCSICHIEVNETKELERLRGAKYSQSDLGTIYCRVKENLDNGRYVLFSGTPCQVAGLKAFLKENYERLVCVDIICHGVPSPLVWKRYIEQIHSAELPKKVSFRSKESGWSHYQYSIRMEYEDGTLISQKSEENIFLKGMIQNIYQRPSCSQCLFKGDQHLGDITLGDFWAIWNLDASFDDNKGVSAVIVNNEKGNSLLEMCKEQFEIKRVLLEDVKKENPSWEKSSGMHVKRDEFFDGLERNGKVDELVHKFTDNKCARKNMIDYLAIIKHKIIGR